MLKGGTLPPVASYIIIEYAGDIKDQVDCIGQRKDSKFKSHSSLNGETLHSMV